MKESTKATKKHLLPWLKRDETPEYFLDMQHVVEQCLTIDTWQFVKALLMNWLIIAVTVVGYIAVDSYWLLPLAMIIIGTRQHSLAILAHEGVHGNIMRNRKKNNFVAKWFCAYPVGLNFDDYKYTHLQHHRHVSDAYDPDYQFFQKLHSIPSEKSFYLKFFTQLILGGGFYEMLRFKQTMKKNNPKAKALGFDNILEALLVIFLLIGWFSGNWHPLINYLCLWILPFGIVTYPINSFRAMLEHYGLPAAPKEDKLRQSRSIKASFWERCLFAPCHVNFHLEHHLYENVPFYNLPKLNQSLLAIERFKESAPVYDTYFSKNGAFRQIGG